MLCLSGFSASDCALHNNIFSLSYQDGRQHEQCKTLEWIADTEIRCQLILTES